jgi:transcriptional regulator of acetoin/glycerol metabolism
MNRQRGRRVRPARHQATRVSNTAARNKLIVQALHTRDAPPPLTGFIENLDPLSGNTAKVVDARRDIEVIGGRSKMMVWAVSSDYLVRKRIALEIHRASSRPAARFHVFPVQQIPKRLLTAELCGVGTPFLKKGREGAIEHAHGGTLFIDFDTSPETEQLIVLKQVNDWKTVVRYGETLRRPVDVRLVVGCDNPDDEAVLQLNGCTIAVPGIR